MSNCKCSMAIRVNGDGCRYCQPQEYIDKLSEWLEESRAEVMAYEEKIAAHSAEPVQGEAAAYIPVDRETGEHWHPVKRKGSGHFCDYIPLYTAAAKPDAELLDLLRQCLDAMRAPYSDTRLMARIDAKLSEANKP